MDILLLFSLRSEYTKYEIFRFSFPIQRDAIQALQNQGPKA